MVQFLHRIFILHEFSGRDLPVANVDPIHELYKRLVGVSNDKVFPDGSYQNFPQGTVHVLGQMVLLVCDGDVSIQRVDRIGRPVNRFSWTDKCNLGVECVLLISHGDVRAAMLPSYEFVLKFARICDAFHLHDH